jgi:hypothetical protein
MRDEIVVVTFAVVGFDRRAGLTIPLLLRRTKFLNNSERGRRKRSPRRAT